MRHIKIRKLWLHVGQRKVSKLKLDMDLRLLKMFVDGPQDEELGYIEQTESSAFIKCINKHHTDLLNWTSTLCTALWLWEAWSCLGLVFFGNNAGDCQAVLHEDLIMCILDTYYFCSCYFLEFTSRTRFTSAQRRMVSVLLVWTSQSLCDRPLITTLQSHYRALMNTE